MGLFSKESFCLLRFLFWSNNFFKYKYQMYRACKFQWRGKRQLLISWYSCHAGFNKLQDTYKKVSCLFSGATLSMRPAPIPIEDPEWRQTPPPVSATSGTFRLRRGSRFTWRKECLAVMERYLSPFSRNNLAKWGKRNLG